MKVFERVLIALNNDIQLAVELIKLGGLNSENNFVVAALLALSED